MRFRRSFIASLAPLIGLSALLAAVSAEGGVAGGAKPLIRLLQSVVQLGVQLAAPAVDYAPAGPSQDRPTPQVLLAFAALAVTPLGASLWMLAQRPAIDVFARRHLLVPLRL